MTRAHYTRMAAAAGLSVKEAYLMAPGELYDVFELYLQAHSIKHKKSEEDY